MTGLIVFCALLFAGGLVVGYYVGDWLGVRREVADRRERVQEARTLAWTRQLRAAKEPGYMMGYRLSVNGQQVYDWQHDDPEPFSPEAAAAAWDGHVGQALALTRPGQAAAAFDVEAETARYAQVADEIIAWVHAASEPWVGP